jgi:hypothetical protein
MTRARDVFAMELIIRQSCGCGSNGGIAHGAADMSGQDIADRFDHDCMGRGALSIACAGCLGRKHRSQPLLRSRSRMIT